MQCLFVSKHGISLDTSSFRHCLFSYHPSRIQKRRSFPPATLHVCTHYCVYCRSWELRRTPVQVGWISDCRTDPQIHTAGQACRRADLCQMVPFLATIVRFQVRIPQMIRKFRTSRLILSAALLISWACFAVNAWKSLHLIYELRTKRLQRDTTDSVEQKKSFFDFSRCACILPFADVTRVFTL